MRRTILTSLEILSAGTGPVTSLRNLIHYRCLRL
jgi:hypothetical protein